MASVIHSGFTSVSGSGVGKGIAAEEGTAADGTVAFAMSIWFFVDGQGFGAMFMELDW